MGVLPAGPPAHAASGLVTPWLAAFLAVAASHALAQDPARLTLMVSGTAKMIYLPATLAQRLGYFHDEGLDVELLSQPAGVDAESELLTGFAQGVVGFYDHTIDLQAKGRKCAPLSYSVRCRARRKSCRHGCRRRCSPCVTCAAARWA